MTTEKKQTFPYKYMTGTLEDIHYSKVTLKQFERCRYTWQVSSAMDKLLPLMRETDDDFDNMRPYYQFAGSFYEGTEISTPHVLNVNIILSLPHFKTAIEKKKIKLETKAGSPFFCDIISPIEYPHLSTEKSIKVKPLLKFLKDVILKTVLAINSSDECPIGNIMIISNKDPLDYGLCLDIDGVDLLIKLVPTFGFKVTKIPKNSKIKNLDKARILGPEYCLVPVAFNDKMEWMMSFPQQEKKLLRSKYNLKYALRLIKVLRNSQGFAGLTDYMIKTVFLLEAEKMSPIFWMSPRGDVLMHMLRSLNKYLESGDIPNYWYRDLNMLLEIEQDLLKNWSGILNNIINDIEKNGNKNNTQVIMKYFKLVPQTLTFININIY